MAAVDLGSNSFRLQMARISGGQVYPMDSLKEAVRLGAGLRDDKHLDEDSQARALAALSRFAERLRGLAPEAVRAVGTNTLRIAKNSREFLRQAQQVLGFPIDIVAGHEEARLIYLGVSHGAPTPERRLVVDIGGGSTELIIGQDFVPIRLESLYMGCVSYSRRFFADGKVSVRRFEEAELAARSELQTIATAFSRQHWKTAIGSSGSARAIADTIRGEGWDITEGITLAGMHRLRKGLIKAGDFRKFDFEGLSFDRKPVIAGGLAIMIAVFEALGVEQMETTEHGMRDGVLWDMLGRLQHHDIREASVADFIRRYHVDEAQAHRVQQLATHLFRQFFSSAPHEPHLERLLIWSTQLHEIGLSIAYSGYHRHSAYILENADMPGFSRGEQAMMGHIVLGQRGAIAKAAMKLSEEAEWFPLLALRLAVLFHRGRVDYNLPDLQLTRRGNTFELRINRNWLNNNQLVSTALEAEAKAWRSTAFQFELHQVDD